MFRSESRPELMDCSYALHFLCEWDNYDHNLDRLFALTQQEIDAGHQPSLQVVQAMAYPTSPIMLKKITEAGANAMMHTVSQLPQISLAVPRASLMVHHRLRLVLAVMVQHLLM